MTQNEANTALSAILTTALETEPDTFQESFAYMALGSDLEKWQMIRGILIDAELVEIMANTIRLTDAGRDMARKCQAFASVAA